MCRTKLSAGGSPSLVLLSRVVCTDSSRDLATFGIWTKSAVTIKGEKFRPWRAVDQNGVVSDEILRRRREKKAAKRLLRRVMKKQERAPKRVITDKLRSYGTAKRKIAPRRRASVAQGL